MELEYEEDNFKSLDNEYIDSIPVIVEEEEEEEEENIKTLDFGDNNFDDVIKIPNENMETEEMASQVKEETKGKDDSLLEKKVSLDF
jgi:hypothetical protein